MTGESHGVSSVPEVLLPRWRPPKLSGTGRRGAGHRLTVPVWGSVRRRTAKHTTRERSVTLFSLIRDYVVVGSSVLSCLVSVRFGHGVRASVSSPVGTKSWSGSSFFFPGHFSFLKKKKTNPKMIGLRYEHLFPHIHIQGIPKRTVSSLGWIASSNSYC